MATKKKMSIFRLTNRNERPSVKGRYYAASFRVPSIDEVYDDSTGTNRVIRYVLGEQSIYEDEQTSSSPVLGDIIFNNGSLPVPYQQVMLRKFLEASNYNRTNPDRIPGRKVLFELLDTEVNAQKNLESLETEFAAMDTLMAMDAQKMVGYARAMGVNVDRSMYEIKHDMMVMAKNDAELFLSEISNPKTERKQILMEAEDERLININTAQRQIFLGFGNKDLITTIPVGINPMEHLVDFTFTEDGKEYFKTIRKTLHSDGTPSTPEKKKASKKK